MLILITLSTFTPIATIATERRLFGAAGVGVAITDLALTVLTEISALVYTVDVFNTIHTPSAKITGLAERTEVIAALMVHRVTGGTLPLDAL